MTVWRMSNSSSTKEYKHMHSQYAILIAFPLQQLLHEQAFEVPVDLF